MRWSSIAKRIVGGGSILLIALTASASAASISITYTGIVTSGAYGTPTTLATNLAGLPFTLSFNFDTSLRTGSAGFGAGGGSGSVGTSACGISCTVQIYQASVGSTSQFISYNVGLAGGTASASISDPGIPGDITAYYALAGLNLGSGFFNSFQHNGPGISADLRIDTVVANPQAVPLPAALPLFASGLGAMAWMARRRKRGQEQIAGVFLVTPNSYRSCSTSQP